MGWFEHGSTIIVLAPQGLELCERWREGGRIRMGRRCSRRAARMIKAVCDAA
jgi:phosphatidylserine decarboxylase